MPFTMQFNIVLNQVTKFNAGLKQSIDLRVGCMLNSVSNVQSDHKQVREMADFGLK